MSGCDYCLDLEDDAPGPYCDAEDPQTAFICTRPKGHDGPHVACIPAIRVAAADHQVAEWDRREEVV